jgi:hypothetical protein
MFIIRAVNSYRWIPKFTSMLMSLALVVAAMPGAAIADDESISFDGLKLLEDSGVAMAYIDPDADFSVFQRIMILDPFVSFTSDWQRDQNRNRRRNINARDMERIKTDTANLFRDVFIEQLESAGFEVVNYIDYDVLILRPAIIDLNLSAPDIRTAGRSRTFSATAGAATLYIELFDSVSGSVIGRAADRQAARNSTGNLSWSNRVTNHQEGRRMFRGWADTLTGFLNQHYMKKEGAE